jgi:hypothetical protein
MQTVQEMKCRLAAYPSHASCASAVPAAMHGVTTAMQAFASAWALVLHNCMLSPPQHGLSSVGTADPLAASHKVPGCSHVASFCLLVSSISVSCKPLADQENHPLVVYWWWCCGLTPFFVGYQGGGTPTGWPHTAQSGKPDCRGPEAKPHQRDAPNTLIPAGD